MPSTALRDIVCDHTARTLDVAFIASGRRYRDFDVLADEYEARPGTAFAAPEAHFCDRT
ncbi:MAG: hypothetical protein JNL14_01080 [Devosia sp.]|uniref:hypothetical protein n=1 Tax=Devosia sp. TaxID=1871048 RepID=UPI001A645782|nr:hypothetical protein [Devosia sp.]MBL8596311.1 hypothetical protein [Devosia sp.]